MTLSQKQRLFTKLVGQLIIKAYDEGYELTFGDAFRSPEEAKRLGFENSNHTRRLAVDFNLFEDGVYQTTSKSHQRLGDWWKQQHPLCAWGGDFVKPDGNHYSFKHGKVK